MTNQEVIKKFLQGETETIRGKMIQSSTGHLWIQKRNSGKHRLMNYSTAIASLDSQDTVSVTSAKYSRTTSKICGQLCNEISASRMERQSATHEDLNSWND